ncbi:low temperature requirement protein A [Labedella populi]|uniref:Low temperature requirement protein A n=1 Tax=Labedella populi TaxID=2498850 RepID=A0A3S3ZZ96_9MICO|nr:low temperature requirement protein A [Labedella populi]RWZ68191.1 low temperature requirement protein A [Labedella populi]
MTAPVDARAGTPPSGDHRATPLELFFDLVYVFAFTQVTHLMAAEASVTSVLGGVAVLGVLWWSWASHAWLANQSTADHGVVRVGIILAIVMVLALSIAIPEVYPRPGESRFGALLFAVGFVALSLAYTGVNIVVAGRDLPLRRQVLRTMGITIVPVSAALIAGAVLGGTAQLTLWSAAVVIEGITVYLTSRNGEWQLPSVGHYAERHGLVVILALGESIISIGLGATHATLSPVVVVGSLLAATLALGMWWQYFDRLPATAERYIAALTGTRRTAVATAGTYLHFGIVAGILLASTGIGSAIEHIDVASHAGAFTATALTGGVALFFVSTAAYVWRTTHRLPRSSVVAAGLALALTPAMSLIPPLTALGIIALLTLGLTAYQRLCEHSPHPDDL